MLVTTKLIELIQPNKRNKQFSNENETLFFSGDSERIINIICC